VATAAVHVNIDGGGASVPTAATEQSRRGHQECRDEHKPRRSFHGRNLHHSDRI